MAYEFKNSKGRQLLPALQGRPAEGRPEADHLLLRPRRASRRPGRGPRRLQVVQETAKTGMPILKKK
ncbi:MAG: hypothetical protein MZV64_63410 [Ignavibacteriales bacterium]|nr:hypothetical protein [Ignavibacteriales bacterium]